MNVEIEPPSIDGLRITSKADIDDLYNRCLSSGHAPSSILMS